MFLDHLPSKDHISTRNTGNGSIETYKFIHIPLEIQNIGIQLRLLVCNSAAYTDILLGHDAMLALGMWQDYPQEKLYIKQTAILFRANKQISIPPGKKTTFPITLALTSDSYQLKHNITGHIPVWITPEATYLPYTLIFSEILDSQIIITITNQTTSPIQLPITFNYMYLDMRLISKSNQNINDQADYTTLNSLLHSDKTTKGPIVCALDTRPFADESHIDPDDHPHLVFLEKPLKLAPNNINSQDPYPWLDKEDPCRNMKNMEILKLKVNLDNSILNDQQKEDFYTIIHQNRDVSM